MRRALWFAPITALVFFLLGSWLGPKGISYWFTPPVLAGAPVTFSCTPSIDWAMTHLLIVQMSCTLAGLIAGVLLTWWLNRRAAKHEAAQLAANANQTSGASAATGALAK